MAGSAPATESPSSGGFLAIALLIWTFMWDNARTLPSLADARVTTLLPIPNSFRLIEVGVVVALFVAGLLRVRQWDPDERSGVVLLLCLLMLSATSVIVAVISELVAPAASLQAVYAFLSPLLVMAAIGMHASATRRVDVAKRLLTVFTLLVGVSVAVAWYESIALGAVGDDVHGLMRNAHHFASAVWVVVLWLGARFVGRIGSRLWNLAGIAAFTPMALLAANEKSNVAFAIVLLVTLAVVLWRRGAGGRVLVVATTLILLGAIRAAATGDLVLPKSFLRLQLVLENLSGVGFVDGYRQLGSVVGEYPRTWFVGTGPASYGSIKAVDQVVLGGYVPPLAARYTAESYRLMYAAQGTIGSYVEKSTDVSAFFVEFGPVCFALLLGVVWFLAVSPALDALRQADPVVTAVGRWLVLSIGFVGALSAFTAFYGWESIQATIWPIMLVAGLLRSGVGLRGAQALDPTTP